MPIRKPKLTSAALGALCDRVRFATVDLTQQPDGTERIAIASRLESLTVELEQAELVTTAGMMRRLERNHVLADARAALAAPRYTVRRHQVLDRGRFLVSIAHMTEQDGPAMSSDDAARLREHIAALLNANPFTPTNTGKKEM